MRNDYNINKLEFADGEQLGVLHIYGGPKFMFNKVRDTLSFYFRPEELGGYNIDGLRTKFSDAAKTDKMYFIDSSGNKVLIGNGYTMLGGCVKETRKVGSPAGQIVEPAYVEEIVITMAQRSFDEPLEGDNV